MHGMGKNRMAPLRLGRCNMGFYDTPTKTPVRAMSLCSALFIHTWYIQSSKLDFCQSSKSTWLNSNCLQEHSSRIQPPLVDGLNQIQCLIRQIQHISLGNLSETRHFLIVIKINEQNPKKTKQKIMKQKFLNSRYMDKNIRTTECLSHVHQFKLETTTPV